MDLYVQTMTEREGWVSAMRMRRSTMRHAEHALLQALLSGALLSPIIAAIVGWGGAGLRHLTMLAYLSAMLGTAAAIASPHFREQRQHALRAYVAAPFPR